jgi:hypothetical protein
MENILVQKVHKNFTCDICIYSTCRNSQYIRHLSTSKHIKMVLEINTIKMESQSQTHFTCKICDKVYNGISGLWKHKKICKIQKKETINKEINNTIIIPSIDDKMLNIIQEHSSFKKIILDLVNKKNEENNDLTNSNELQNIIIDLQKQNNDLQKQVLEVCKNIQPGINNSMNNSNNKTFNLNLFLNEQCKDAMNMSDFVNSFHLKMEDLESVGELGYVEGISKLLVNKLNDLDVYKRPMHCSDAKRETLYVKDQDKWEKEQNDNPKIRKAIKKISHRNTVLLSEWRDTHPGSRVSTSEVNTQYMSLVRQSNGGNEDITDSENKIIRRLAKEVVIAK